MDTKRVRVVDPNQPGQDRTAEVTRGSSASDVLRSAGLNPSDYILLNPATQAQFTPTESVYAVCEDQGKLHVVMASNVGA